MCASLKSPSTVRSLASAIEAPCCEPFHCVFSAVWHDAQVLVPTNEGSGGSTCVASGLLVRAASPNAASATAATPIALAATSRVRERRVGGRTTGGGASLRLERVGRERFFVTLFQGRDRAAGRK